MGKMGKLPREALYQQRGKLVPDIGNLNLEVDPRERLYQLRGKLTPPVPESCMWENPWIRSAHASNPP